MHQLFKKFGLGDTLAAILMILFGVAILVRPNLLEQLVAFYLILVGVLKLAMR